MIISSARVERSSPAVHQYAVWLFSKQFHDAAFRPCWMVKLSVVAKFTSIGYGLFRIFIIKEVG